MNDFLSIIDKRITWALSKVNMLKKIQAKVIYVSNDNVIVELNSGSQITVKNYSGNFCRENDIVQIFYWGTLLNGRSAYIGRTPNAITVCDTLEYSAKANTLYFLEDTGKIYIGNVQYGGSGGGAGIVSLTLTEYQALTYEEKMADVLYLITDA